MDDFNQCTALITGASSGIGLELARELAPVAKRLILIARREELLARAKSELQLINPSLRVDYHRVDLSNSEEVENLANQLKSDSDINFLINNAAVGDGGLFETSDWQKSKAMLRVNIEALTYLCRILIPTLHQHKTAAILNISSVAGLIPVPQFTVYCATKAYVNSFSEALRGELRGTAISVTHVCPGPVETDFVKVNARPSREVVIRPGAKFMNVSAHQVAIESLNAVLKDRARVVPGLVMWLITIITAIMPMIVFRYFFSLKSGDIRREVRS